MSEDPMTSLHYEILEDEKQRGASRFSWQASIGLDAQYYKAVEHVCTECD